MNIYNHLRRFGFLLIFALLGGASAPPTTAPTTAPAAPAAEAAINVKIDNFKFDPETITIPAGTTVTWTNHDDVPHTVTADTKAFTSGALDTDDKYTHTFTARGQYDYYCAVHPHMTGRVIVK